MNDEVILTEIKELIRKGKGYSENLHKLYELVNYRGLSNEGRYPSLRKWEYTARNLLKLRFGKDSDFLHRFIECVESTNSSHEYYKENVELATAALEYVYESLSKGFTDDLFYKREILLFSDLLKQAEEFLRADHKLAAAIYGRIVLESTIIQFAKKNNITEPDKFEQLIIKLRKNGIIHSPFENSLRSNYKIGSLAAHGDKEFEEFSKSEVREFLSFIRDKVLTL